MATADESATTQELLKGILAMLVAEREEQGAEAKDKRKTEVILAAAGLKANTIAALVNKNEGAVRKTIQRAR